MKNFSRNLLFRILIFLKIVLGKKICRKIVFFLTRGEEFAYLESLYCPETNKAESVGYVLLPGPCSWGKCTMCGFQQAVKEFTQDIPFSGKNLALMFQLGLQLISGPRKIMIFTGGSFLDLPLTAQKKILTSLKDDASCRHILIESRAELISLEKIMALKKQLGPKQLEVAIGLETQDDEIRQKCINKGFSRADYQKAVKVLKAQDVLVSTYVFLKPVGVNERLAIAEAIKTIEFAFQSGSDSVGLESAFVQPGTKMAVIYEQGMYQPPWLWSIIEVLKKTHHLGPIQIGNFENEYPLPLAVPKNCPRCSAAIYKQLKNYRQMPDLNLLSNLTCACKKEWLEKCNI
ncbi:MAG: radical SAM protein [Patescibacteria group bacterium]